MSSFRLYLDMRSPRKDGTFPLKIAVHHRKTFMLNLKVYTTPDNLIENEVIIPDNHARQKSLNFYIQGRLTHIESTLNKLRLLGSLNNLSDAELKKMLDCEQALVEEDAPVLFMDHWRQFVTTKTKGTQRLYGLTEAKLRSYCKPELLMFDDITVNWLRNFDRWMSQSCSANTRSIHMRNIRAVFNDAIDYEVIEQNLYPFRKFKIKSEKTRKRSLSVEELRALMNHPCEPHQEKYRDIFMLIFYLVGINIVDLLGLKKLQGDRVEYKRAKTGRLYSIKVEPEALKIIEKYRGKDFLLSFSDIYSNYMDFARKLNKNLKEIGTLEILPRKNGRPGKKEYKGLFPELTTYWARHTWATIAAGLDIPKETIAAALGHGGNTVTDIYIDFDQRKVDEANRKVIDYLNADKEKCAG